MDGHGTTLIIGKLTINKCQNIFNYTICYLLSILYFKLDENLIVLISIYNIRYNDINRLNSISAERF